jgi:hypothetical protein
MTETTPKERYDARMKLKRDAQQPDHKTDDIVNAEYAFHLAERFVKSCESFAFSFSIKTF